jgi:hypothetical protein
MSEVPFLRNSRLGSGLPGAYAPGFPVVPLRGWFGLDGF